MLENLQECKWVGKSLNGLFYDVNSKFIFQKKLTSSEGAKIWDDLTKAELDLLKNLKLNVNDENEWDANENFDYYTTQRIHEEDLNEELEHLVSMGLVHVFEDVVFLSVTNKSVDFINNAIYDEMDDDLVISYIAYPMLLSVIENKGNERTVIDLPFVPKACKKYVVDGLLDYTLSGTMPEKMLEDLDDDELDFFFNESNRHAKPNGGKFNTLKFEIVEAFLGAVNFKTKAQYVSEAKHNAETITGSNLCSVAFKAAAKAAVEEIEDLTLSNIKEIQKIIKNSREDDNKDDE